MKITQLIGKPALTITTVSLLAICSSLHAAPAFNPSASEPQFINEPQVIVAPIALSNNDLRPDGATGYRPWFENGAWQGDLIELNISPTGVVSSTVDLSTSPPTSITNGNWSARIRFDQAARINESFWEEDRTIIIGQGADNRPRPFRWLQLSAAQKRAIDADAVNADSSDILDFIRGDRSNERTPANQTNDLRRRLSVLGDIIHSPPQYVAAPNQNLKVTSQVV